jgi:hypothetical protein
VLFQPAEDNGQYFLVKGMGLGGVANLLQECPLGVVVAKFVTHPGDLFVGGVSWMKAVDDSGHEKVELRSV